MDHCSSFGTKRDAGEKRWQRMALPMSSVVPTLPGSRAMGNLSAPWFGPSWFSGRALTGPCALRVCRLDTARVRKFARDARGLCASIDARASLLRCDESLPDHHHAVVHVSGIAQARIVAAGFAAVTAESAVTAAGMSRETLQQPNMRPLQARSGAVPRMHSVSGEASQNIRGLVTQL